MSVGVITSDAELGNFVIEELHKASHPDAVKLSDLWNACGKSLANFRIGVKKQFGPKSNSILSGIDGFLTSYQSIPKPALNSINSGKNIVDPLSKIEGSGSSHSNSSSSSNLKSASSSSSSSNQPPSSSNKTAQSAAAVSAAAAAPPPAPKIVEDPVFADLEKIESFQDSLTIIPILRAEEITQEIDNAAEILMNSMRRKSPRRENLNENIDWKNDFVLDAGVMNDVLKMKNISFGPDIGEEALKELSSTIQSHLSIIIRQSIEKNKIRRNVSMKSKYEDICDRIALDPEKKYGEEDVKRLMRTKFGPNTSEILHREENQSRSRFVRNLQAAEEKAAGEAQNETKKMRTDGQFTEDIDAKSFENLVYHNIKSAVAESIQNNTWDGVKKDVSLGMFGLQETLSGKSDPFSSPIRLYKSSDNNNNNNTNTTSNSNNNQYNGSSSCSSSNNNNNNNNIIVNSGNNTVEVSYMDVAHAIKAVSEPHPYSHAGGPLSSAFGTTLQRKQLGLLSMLGNDK